MRGKVVDAEKRPIPRAAIYVPGWRSTSPVPTLRTDAEGAFVLPGAPVGDLYLLAVAEGFASEATTVLGGEGDERETVLALGRKAAVATLVCTDAAGRRMAGAEAIVEARADGGGSWSAQPVRCDAEGRVRIVGVSDGRFRVRARTPDGAMADAEVDVADGKNVEVPLAFGVAIAVEGRVFGPDGAPVGAGIDVQVVVSESYCLSDLSRKTDAEGRVRFPPLIAKNGFSVGASHRDLGAARVVFGVEACAADVAFELRLAFHGVVRARVLDARGAPAADVSIDVSSVEPPDGDGDWISSDADGRAISVPLAPGRYALTASARSTAAGWVAAAKVEAVAGGPEVELRLPAETPATCGVRGRLVDADGKPVNSVRVFCGHAADTEDLAPSAVSDRDGKFALAGLVPGSFVLRLDDPRTGLQRLPERYVGPGETFDFGDVPVGAPAEIVFRRPVVADEFVFCTLFLEYGGAPRAGEWLRFDDSGVAVRSLGPGTYEPILGLAVADGRAPLKLGPCAAGPRFALRGAEKLSPLHVSAGVRQEIELPRPATRAVPIFVQFPPTEVPPQSADDSDENRTVAVDVQLFLREDFRALYSAEVSDDGSTAFEFTSSLPVGVHRVRARAAGRIVETKFEVSPSTPESADPPPVRLVSAR